MYLYDKSRRTICDLECRDVICTDMCLYMCERSGGVLQWIFQFHVVFSFAYRRFHPSASSFALARSKPRSISLTLEVCAACLCTAVIYSLLESYCSGFSLGSESQSDGGGAAGWQAREKFVDFEPSERGEFVDIYTATASDVSRTVLEASRNTTGRGHCSSKLHSSHIELISRVLEAVRS